MHWLVVSVEYSTLFIRLVGALCRSAGCSWVRTLGSAAPGHLSAAPGLVGRFVEYSAAPGRL